MKRGSSDTGIRVVLSHCSIMNIQQFNTNKINANIMVNIKIRNIVEKDRNFRYINDAKSKSALSEK